MTNEEYLSVAKNRIVRMFADANAEINDTMFSGKYGLYIGQDGCVHSVVNYNSVEFYCGKQKLKELKDRLLNYVNVRTLAGGFYFSFTLTELEIAYSADTSEEDREKVLAKVQKLLALADTDRNSSEAEAIAASVAAQKLLAKHNMSMADLDKERREEIDRVYADVDSKRFKWSLGCAVAESYCCKCYACGKTTIVFYGYKSDALIARRVFQYLVGVCDRLARHTAYEYRKEHGYADGIYNSFAKGFVAGVASELKKSCTALALIVPEKVEESFAELQKTFGKKPVNSHIDAYNKDSYLSGVREGKAALNAQYISSENEGTKYDASDVKLIGNRNGEGRTEKNCMNCDYSMTEETADGEGCDIYCLKTGKGCPDNLQCDCDGKGEGDIPC